MALYCRKKELRGMPRGEEERGRVPQELFGAKTAGSV